MATLASIKPSITEMSYSESYALIIAIRESRRTRKKPMKKATKQRLEKKDKFQAAVDQLSQEDILELLQKLEAQTSD